MINRLFLVLAALACFSSFAHAEEKEEVHSYFLGASLGFASVNYHTNSNLQSFADAQASTTQAHVPYAMDFVFLIALPNRQTAVGAGLSFAADAYFPKSSYDYAGINQGSLVATIHHYFGQEIGRGVFVLGDLGVASVSSTSDSLNYKASSSAQGGFVWLAGGGYGFALGKQVSLNLEVDYSRVSLSSGAIANLQYKGGILVYL